MSEKTSQQQQLENQLRQIERRLIETYLEKKRPIRVILKYLLQLTDGQREKFHKLFPKGINESNLAQAGHLVERTIKMDKE